KLELRPQVVQMPARPALIVRALGDEIVDASFEVVVARPGTAISCACPSGPVCAAQLDAPACELHRISSPDAADERHLGRASALHDNLSSPTRPRCGGSQEVTAWVYRDLNCPCPLVVVLETVSAPLLTATSARSAGLGPRLPCRPTGSPDA